LFIGQRLCHSSRLEARRLGFAYLCGRVVEGNDYGVMLAKWEGAQEVTGIAPWALSGFRWFQVETRCQSTP